MQREMQNKQNNPGKEKKEGYIIVTNYFLKKWVRVLGVGPIVLYQELLTYCHKGKYIAWPTLNTLCQEMGIAKTTLLRYQNTLIKFGLIKNISRGKSTTGHYRNNIYQVTPLEKIPDHRDIRYQNDTDIGSKTIPDRFQNDTCIGSKMKLSLVSNRYPNNTNLNNINLTAAKGGKDAAAADFKKLKEKGDLSACVHAQAEEKMQAIRERMVELDFEEEFIEQLLKEYPVEKIDKKLDLLIERRNIQNPTGWLRTALKNDYRNEEQERCDEEPVRQESQSIPHPHLNPPPSRGRKFVDCPAQKEEEFKEGLETGSQLSPSKWTSREKALEAIGLIRDNLSLSVYPLSPRRREPERERM